MTLDPARRFRLESAMLYGVLAATVLGASVWGWFGALNRAAHDTLLRLYPDDASAELLIVGIDEHSLHEYGPWPWSRVLQARLLEALADAGPEAVLVDVVHAGRTEAAADAALARAAARLPLLGLPILIDAMATGRPLVEVLPYPDLLDQADVLGHVHVEMDPDAVVRGTYLWQGIGEARWPHLALAIAAAVRGGSGPDSPCPASVFTVQNVRCGWAYVPFVGPPGSFPEISAADVLEGGVPAAALAGRIVLLGVTAAAASDRLPSPVSGDRNPMSGVEFNANLLNAFLNDRLILAAPFGWVVGLGLACVALPALLLPRLQPKAMVGAALLSALVPIALMALGHLFWRVHLPLAAAAVAALLAYPYWSWRRHEIAWHFVAEEMSRVSVQRSRWLASSDDRDPGEELARLARLLDAQWLPDPATGPQDGGASAADGPPTAGRAEVQGLRLEGPLPGVLARSEPFTLAERTFAQRVTQRLEPPGQAPELLPGEQLAARIRHLQRASEEVRTARDVSLRGLAGMPNGIAVLSAVGEVLFLNGAARTLLGLNDGGQPADSDALLAALVPPLGKGWRAIARSVVVSGDSVVFETRTCHGEPVLFESAPLAAPGEPVDYWVVTVTDMSDIRAAERDRAEALAFLSHDLRSPMLSVLALVRGADYSPVLADIGRYAEKALSASEQFLQLSRVQTREQFETYELNLLDVLRNAVDQTFVLARERGQRIELDASVDATEDGVWMEGNGELLERAFANLLGNAVKYSDPGGEVRVSVEPGSGWTTVHVADRGVGIPEAEQSRVFEPFFRSSVPALAERRGAGLGLRFVKTVVERHGGSVALDSAPGEGSTFSVTLPVRGAAPVSG